MKATKLATIAITLIVVTLAIGCDEAAMIEDIVSELGDEGAAQQLAELKVEPEVLNVTISPNNDHLLVWPPEDATDEEMEQHADLVRAASVNVNLLDISGCAPNPVIIEVGVGEAIEIKNSDEIEHTLYHGEVSITIPPGATRGIVVSEFLGVEDAIAGYGCGDQTSGIFYINPNLVVKPSERQRYVSFKVVGVILPHNRSPGIEGVTVTVLEGVGVTKKTASDGSVTFKRDHPFIVRLEKEGFTATEVVVTEEGEEVVFADQQGQITFRVVEPLLPNKNGPGIGGVTVTCLEGSDEGKKITAADGSVTFFGTPPLTIKIEKPGYITTETMVVGGNEVPFPNEWPEEVKEAIRQLGLTELVESGWLVLRFGDDEYLPALSKEMGGEDGLGGIIPCPNIIIRKWRGREFMVATLVHELMHAWQGLKSLKPPCGDNASWRKSKEGQAWIATLDKDLEENGPIPDFDDQVYGPPGPHQKLLGEIPSEIQAEFYKVWYIGTEAELKKLYQLAPNRCQYMEDRFGPPPPR